MLNGIERGSVLLCSFWFKNIFFDIIITTEVTNKLKQMETNVKQQKNTFVFNFSPPANRLSTPPKILPKPFVKRNDNAKTILRSKKSNKKRTTYVNKKKRTSTMKRTIDLTSTDNKHNKEYNNNNN